MHVIYNKDHKQIRLSQNLRGIRTHVQKHLVRRVDLNERSDGSGELYVLFDNGDYYRTEFASWEVLRDFVRRWRALYGALLYVNGKAVGTVNAKNARLISHYPRGNPMQRMGETWIEGEERAYNTYSGAPSGSNRRGKVRFPDGKLRMVRLGVADTFFTIPAISSHSGSGHVMFDEDKNEFVFHLKGQKSVKKNAPTRKQMVTDIAKGYHVRRRSRLPEGWKTIGRNTYYKEEDGYDLFKLHKTIIVKKDGRTGAITLNSGGYKTLTTKAVINQILEGMNIPLKVTQHKRNWYVWDAVKRIDIPFIDGMTIARAEYW